MIAEKQWALQAVDELCYSCGMCLESFTCVEDKAKLRLQAREDRGTRAMFMLMSEQLAGRLPKSFESMIVMTEHKMGLKSRKRVRGVQGTDFKKRYGPEPRELPGSRKAMQNDAKTITKQFTSIGIRSGAGAYCKKA